MSAHQVLAAFAAVLLVAAGPHAVLAAFAVALCTAAGLAAVVAHAAAVAGGLRLRPWSTA